MELGVELTAHLEDQKSIDRVKKSLITLAKKLNRIDWASRISITDDFLVYVVDYEKPDWESYIRAIAPKRVLRRLEAKGLLEEII